MIIVYALSNMTFLLNSTFAGSSFNPTPPGNSEYGYNYTVFASEELPLGTHNLTVVNGGGSVESHLLLDRIIYT